MQSQVRFNRVPKKVPEKAGEGVGTLLNMTWLCTKASHTFSGTFSGTLLNLTWFRRRFRRRPEKVWEAARSCSTGFWNRLRRRFGRLWCRARSVFNRVPKKVPGKAGEGFGEGVGGFGAEAGEVNRVPEKVPEKVPKKVWEALVQSQVRFNRICGLLIHENRGEVFPAVGFADASERFVKNKRLRLLGDTTEADFDILFGFWIWQ